MEIKFKRDTSFRKQFFTPESFAHPAKMDAQLLLWIVERYTKPGEVILDPMAGMGTTMLACTLGRNVVLVELEEKFCKMCKSNWEKVSAMPQLGYEMGQCNIIQGDARQLEGLLVDKCIFSPPYAESQVPPHTPEGEARRLEIAKERGVSPDKVSYLDYTKKDKGLVDRIVTSPPYAEAHDTKNLGVGDGDRADLRAYSWLKEDNPDNISNLPYGQIDKIVTSPPFGEAQSGGGIAQEGYTKPFQKDKIGGGNLDPVGKRSYMPENIGSRADNIQRLPYGNIDSIITSPPYENQVHESIGGIQAREDSGEAAQKGYKKPGQLMPEGYSVNGANIGNLKSDSYLEAMLQVYQQCQKILKPQGLMILVTKNFIRNKQVVRLDGDTIKLCGKAGFSFVERHYRKLTSRSFWRTIYHQKYPGVEEIEYEDVLVFRK